eukprot:tig00020965_g16881.t1
MTEACEFLRDLHQLQTLQGGASRLARKAVEEAEGALACADVLGSAFRRPRPRPHIGELGEHGEDADADVDVDGASMSELEVSIASPFGCRFWLVQRVVYCTNETNPYRVGVYRAFCADVEDSWRSHWITYCMNESDPYVLRLPTHRRSCQDADLPCAGPNFSLQRRIWTNCTAAGAPTRRRDWARFCGGEAAREEHAFLCLTYYKRMEAFGCVPQY